MSYNTVVEMANSQSLISRVAVCAAELGNTTPRPWAGANILQLVAMAGPNLQSVWDTAVADKNGNPDVGYRDDVVTDAMILQVVTPYKTSQAGTQGWPAS